MQKQRSIIEQLALMGSRSGVEKITGIGHDVGNSGGHLKNTKKSKNTSKFHVVLL